MSFICQSCGNHSNGSPKMKVTETRPAVYEERVTIEGRKKTIDKGGQGWEIVKEKKFCEKCYEAAEV